MVPSEKDIRCNDNLEHGGLEKETSTTRFHKQCLEIHENFEGREAPGQRLDVLLTYSLEGGSFSNLTIKGNMSLISSPR